MGGTGGGRWKERKKEGVEEREIHLDSTTLNSNP